MIQESCLLDEAISNKPDSENFVLIQKKSSKFVSVDSRCHASFSYVVDTLDLLLWF